jgi:zinc protease
MKHMRLPLLGLALFGACNTMDSDTNSAAQATADSGVKATASQSAKVFPYEVQRTKLDNGLTVLMIPMPSDGLVSYWSIVRTGSRDEVETGVTGFAHFFEHMMFRGTKKLPGKAYDRIVNGMGADANAFTSDDMTAYHLSFATASLPKVIEIEADRFQNLDYAEEQFKIESGAVYGEYRKSLSSPFAVLDEAVREKAFDKHTYKHTTIGFEADIKAMPTKYEYSKTFFKRFYRPENVVILVTGDFDPKQTLATIKKEYGAWQKGYEAPKITPEPAQTAQRKLDIPFEGKTKPIVALNFKGPAFQPDDRAVMAAKLVGELAFGSTSPLYKKLVLDEQKVLALDGGIDNNRDPGLWTVYAMVKEPGDVHGVEAELWKTIADLQKTPVARERLDAVRSNLRYSFLSNLSTPADVAQMTARYIALTGDLSCIDTMFTTIAAVTPDDVRKAAERWLRPESCTVAILHYKDQPIPAMSSVIDTSAPSVAAKSEKSGVRYSFADAAAPVLAFDSGTVSEKPVLLPVKADPTVSFRIWFQVGSQDDPVGKEGLAALTGDLISEGATKKNAYDQILTKLFPMAAGYNVTVDKEMTTVSGEVHRDHVTAFYRLLVEAITEPAFSSEDFERIRDDAISGIENSLRYSAVEELAKASLYDRVFQGTRYAHIAAGTVASLQSITIDDVKRFHAKYYSRDNVVIGMGGSYPADLPEQMKRDLGVLPSGKAEHPAAPAAQKLGGRHVVFVENSKTRDSSISMGVPIDVKRGTKEFYALWLANSWLGEHRNSASHLYQVIREERGINYGDYSYIEAFPRGGGRRMPPQCVARRQQIFEVWLRTMPNANALFSVRAALREIENLVANGLTKEQFEFQRAFLKGYMAHFAESTFERLGYALDDRFYGVDGHLATFKKMMDTITLADVNDAIKRYMKTDELVITIVTPDVANLREAIVSNQPTPVVYPPDSPEKSAAALAEDTAIASWPLKVDAASITVRPVDEMFAGTKP